MSKIVRKIINNLLFLLIIFVFSNEAHSFCLTRGGNIDTECRCLKKNYCMSIMTDKEKKLIGKEKDPTTQKYFNKFTKESLPVYKLAQKAFMGKVDFDNFPYAELDKVNKSLDKYLSKLEPKAEQTYKALGAKTYKLKEREKKYLENTKKKISKRLMAVITKGELSLSGSYPANSRKDLAVTNSATNGEEQSNNSEITALNTAIVEKNNTTNDILMAEAQTKKMIESNKNFKVNDIHKAHLNLWAIISNRYAIARDRLDSRAISAGNFASDKENLKRSILEKLKLY